MNGARNWGAIQNLFKSLFCRSKVKGGIFGQKNEAFFSRKRRIFLTSMCFPMRSPHLVKFPNFWKTICQASDTTLDPKGSVIPISSNPSPAAHQFAHGHPTAPSVCSISPRYGKFYTRENLRWAFAILFSRVVRLTAMGSTLALIPWADMLNHSPTGNLPPPQLSLSWHRPLCQQFSFMSFKSAIILRTFHFFSPKVHILHI